MILGRLSKNARGGRLFYPDGRGVLREVLDPQAPLALRPVVAPAEPGIPFRSRANRIVRLNESGKKKEKFIDDPGGAGRESAREVIVCPACAAQHNGH